MFKTEYMIDAVSAPGNRKSMSRALILFGIQSRIVLLTSNQLLRLLLLYQVKYCYYNWGDGFASRGLYLTILVFITTKEQNAIGS